MIDARICDGDLVFIQHQPTVENGEIAAVLIDDEVGASSRSIVPELLMASSSKRRTKNMSLYSSRIATLNRFGSLGKAVAFQSYL